MRLQGEKALKESLVVKSLKGHDLGRVYLVVATVSEDFVLLVDGEYRKLDNPKQKRRKHIEEIAKVQIPELLTDSEIRKICKI